MQHRKTIRHFELPGHVHELTFSCFERRPLLTNNAWRERLSSCIDTAGTEESMVLNAFVFMPEHVHLIVTPTVVDYDIGRYLARIKQPFSAEIHVLLQERRSSLLNVLEAQERPGKRCFRYWQEGPGYDRNIIEPEAIATAIDYIHRNPVRRKLSTRAVDWEWSSARFYLSEPTCRQYPRMPMVTKPNFG